MVMLTERDHAMSSKKESRRAGRRRRAFRVLGERLFGLRTARGWSQHEAAERASVSDRSIRKAEAGGPLELKTIALLAHLYSTPDAPLNPQHLLAESEQTAGPACAAGHEELVWRVIRAMWSDGPLDVIKELAAPHCVWHIAGNTLYGPTELRRHREKLRPAFTDALVQVEQVIVECDWIASRWQMALTHAGTESRTRAMVIDASAWMRIVNGRVVECWEYFDPQQAADALKIAQPTSKLPSHRPRHRKPP